MINGIGQSQMINLGNLSGIKQADSKVHEEVLSQEKSVNVSWSEGVEFWIEEVEEFDPEFVRREDEIFAQLDQLYGIDYSKKLTGADANREKQLVSQLEGLETKEVWTEADFAKEEELMLEIDKLYGFDPDKQLSPEQLKLEEQLFEKLDNLYKEFFPKDYSQLS